MKNASSRETASACRRPARASVAISRGAPANDARRHGDAGARAAAATIACAPQHVHRRPAPHRDCRHRHAERFLRQGRMGRSSRRRLRPDRAPIAPLQRLLPVLRKAGVPVIWVNWGNRPDLANMPPNQIHLYKPTGAGIGLGDPLPGQRRARAGKGFLGRRGCRRTRRRSPSDIRVDKYRISGFWDTPLDSILRNLGNRIDPVYRRQHRSMRAAFAHRREFPRLWLHPGRRLLRAPRRRISAPRRRSGT